MYTCLFKELVPKKKNINIHNLWIYADINGM